MKTTRSEMAVRVLCVPTGLGMGVVGQMLGHPSLPRGKHTLALVSWLHGHRSGLTAGCSG